MGRSVDYLSNAEYVIYFTADWINENNEQGQYDIDMAQLNWNDFKMNLTSSICDKLKSYYEVKKWDSNEVSIFLENELAEIALSEYYGLYSLSIRAKDDEFYTNAERTKEGLAKKHCQQVRNSLEKCLADSGAELLNRIGTFSNGCGVFEKDKGFYENADRVV